MLLPSVDVKEFEKYGFKPCKGYKLCYYLCVSRGKKMLFVSPVWFEVLDWNEDDPRIHKRANCNYRDQRDWLDIVYDLIKREMLTNERVKYGI